MRPRLIESRSSIEEPLLIVFGDRNGLRLRLIEHVGATGPHHQTSGYACAFGYESHLLVLGPDEQVSPSKCKPNKGG
jgi:hypothetical protein